MLEQPHSNWTAVWCNHPWPAQLALQVICDRMCIARVNRLLAHARARAEAKEMGVVVEQCAFVRQMPAGRLAVLSHCDAHRGRTPKPCTAHHSMQQPQFTSHTMPALSVHVTVAPNAYNSTFLKIHRQNPRPVRVASLVPQHLPRNDTMTYICCPSLNP